MKAYKVAIYVTKINKTEEKEGRIRDRRREKGLWRGRKGRREKKGKRMGENL